jgi:MFS family permease
VPQAGTPIRHRVRARLPFDVDALTAPPIRRLFIGTLLGAFGTGVTFALFVLYCHDIRHVPIFEATLILTWEALLGVAVGPLYGSLIDRHGPSIVLTVTMPITALGIMAIGFASTLPLLFAVGTVLALSGAGLWSAFTVLITRIVSVEHFQDAFGINFWLLNIGIGLGAIVGTQIANLSDLRTFQLLYLLSGLLALGDAAMLFTLRRFGGKLDAAEVTAEQSSEGWGTVLRDRRMVRFTVAGLLTMICGYGSIEAGLPLFVTQVAHLKVHVIGLLVAFNTFTIIVAQLFVLGGVRGRSRSLLLGLVGLLWGGSWLLATSSLAVGAVAAVCLLCLGQILFATGETIWQPAAPAVVNALAPEHLRGRYNSLVGLMWGVAGALGAPIAGLFFQFHAGRAWTIVLAGGAILGGIGLTTMRRVLTAEEDGRQLEDAAVPPDDEPRSEAPAARPDVASVSP